MPLIIFDYWLRITISAYSPPLHLTPPQGRGLPSEYCHDLKLEWFGYLMVKKIEDTITCFDRMYECDGRTDTA